MTEFEGAQKQVTGVMEKYLKSEDNAEKTTVRIFSRLWWLPVIGILTFVTSIATIVITIYLFGNSKMRSEVSENNKIGKKNELVGDSTRRTQDSFMKAKAKEARYQKERDSLFDNLK